ncbi:MAG: DMT family transporter [Austwickia sp.]|nr:MAG: DMT family transporter [Austwickia sp.]
MSRRSLVLFLILGVVWGIPYLLIKYANASFDPATLVCLRTLIGGAVLLPFALRQGALRPLLARWRWVLAYTVIEVGIPWLSLTHAEHVIPSGLAGLLIAATPVVGAILSHLTGRDEQLGRAGGVGLALGLGGVALLFWRELAVPSGPGSGIAMAEMAAVVLCYAVGPQILARRLYDVPGLGVIVVSLLIPAAVLAPFAIAHWPARVEPSAAVAVVLLGVLCTSVAFLCFFVLVGDVGPVRTTVVTYVNTAVAVAAGAVLLGEPVTVLTAIGFVSIVGGSVLVQRRRRPGRTAAAGTAQA